MGTLGMEGTMNTHKLAALVLTVVASLMGALCLGCTVNGESFGAAVTVSAAFLWGKDARAEWKQVTR